MKWEGNRESDNVEDRRDGGGAGGGGGMIGGRGIGIGTIVIALVGGRSYGDSQYNRATLARRQARERPSADTSRRTTTRPSSTVTLIGHLTVHIPQTL